MLTTSAWRARFDRLSGSDWYLHAGDLVVPEDLDHDIALVVDGDLTVHGFLDDHVSGAGLLVVLGDLTVRDLVSRGSVHVTGDLHAEGVVYGYGGEHVLEVGGLVHARALVPAGRSAAYRPGEVGVEIDSQRPTKVQLRSARRLFVPQVYDGGARRAREGRPPKLERPSCRRVRARLHTGKPLFREPAIHETL
ncbi:hypothetical protein [Kitasatospora sp. NPDC002040]|uniref:hypothetical protein n=1 Tax=Kitasatospora sp. NPDC002040 TaxID=3154661 RepID=UPI003319F202